MCMFRATFSLDHLQCDSISFYIFRIANSVFRGVPALTHTHTSLVRLEPYNGTVFSVSALSQKSLFQYLHQNNLVHRT